METKTVGIGLSDGRELCIDSSGDVAGPTILAHMGTPNSRLQFRPWIEDAERRGIHFVSYDRPGYGGSTAQPGRTVADCVNDVRAVADYFGIEHLCVWGISGGGPHALACAALCSDRVAAVASLASIAPYGAPDLDYFTGMGKDNFDDIKLYLEDPAASREKARKDRDEMLALTPELLHESMTTLLSPEDHAAATPELAAHLVESIRVALAPSDEGWWEDGVAHIAPWGFSFDEIRVPVQLWHGVHDQFVPFQHGEWLASKIPGVDAHLTETDGHLTLFERVPDIHSWLLEHL